MGIDIQGSLNSEDGKYISAASHYALEIAMRALKERCDKLQNQIHRLKKENLKLKRSSSEPPNLNEGENNGESLSFLRNKIKKLENQTHQLCHHIFIIATENNELWDKLLKLTDEKKHLEHRVRIMVHRQEEEISDVNLFSTNGEVSCESVGALTQALNYNSHIKEQHLVESDDDVNIISLQESNMSFGSSRENLNIQDDLHKIFQNLNREKLQLKQLNRDIQEAVNLVLNNVKVTNPDEENCNKRQSSSKNHRFYSKSLHDECSEDFNKNVPSAVAGLQEAKINENQTKENQNKSPISSRYLCKNVVKPENEDDPLLNSFEIVTK